jgi:hypothetical protein
MRSRYSPRSRWLYSTSGIGLAVLVLGCVFGFLLVKRSAAQQVVVKKLNMPLVTDVNDPKGNGRGFSLKVYTVEHDRHLYVTTNAGGIIHSHSCPCTR